MAEIWRDEGRLPETHATLPFGERLTRIAGSTKFDWSKHFDISLPQLNVKPDSPIHTTKAIFDLIVNPRLLDVVEYFVGPEIYSNPIQHTRIKPPERMLVPDALTNGLAARVGWHQDQGGRDDGAGRGAGDHGLAGDQPMRRRKTAACAWCPARMRRCSTTVRSTGLGRSWKSRAS